MTIKTGFNFLFKGVGRRRIMVVDNRKAKTCGAGHGRRLEIHSLGVSFKLRCARPLDGARDIALNLIFSPGGDLRTGSCRLARSCASSNSSKRILRSSAVDKGTFTLPGSCKIKLSCIGRGGLALTTSFSCRS